MNCGRWCSAAYLHVRLLGRHVQACIDVVMYQFLKADPLL